MPTEYAVMAETLEGKVMTLRRGFKTHDDAEDHPVQLSLWKRVWITPIDVPPAQPPALPPKPWDWIAAAEPNNNGSFHAYLVDANGKKIAAIWGGNAKSLIADHIIELANQTV